MKYYIVFATESGFAGSFITVDNELLTEENLREAAAWVKKGLNLCQDPVIINWMPVG